ncbi:MAG: type I restriction enzyme HsdR N-terminal domain-containing protein [Candidatus Methylomirabilis sp.]|nr:type I restriction enzyme HsdR N-terminal domain-containing protein [Deltaproteobacteria bacterium]
MPVDISRGLKKYVPIFQQAYEQNINEAETSLRVGKFLEEVLGYDVFQDITKEHTVKDRFVDYAIKLNGKVAFFIEIKQAGIELREKHIEQASNYAANAGVSWVALTNGRSWQLYHLTFDDGIQSDLILSADILAGDLKDASSKISLLHKKCVLKGEHEDFYAKIKVLSPKSVIQAVFQENTLRMIRGHLKKMTGITVDEEDLVASIKQMLSAEVWKDIGAVKVKRQRKATRQRKQQEEQPAVTGFATSPLPESTAATEAECAEKGGSLSKV